MSVEWDQGEDDEAGEYAELWEENDSEAEADEYDEAFHQLRHEQERERQRERVERRMQREEEQEAAEYGELGEGDDSEAEEEEEEAQNERFRALRREQERGRLRERLERQLVRDDEEWMLHRYRPYFGALQQTPQSRLRRVPAPPIPREHHDGWTPPPPASDAFLATYPPAAPPLPRSHSRPSAGRTPLSQTPPRAQAQAQAQVQVQAQRQHQPQPPHSPDRLTHSIIPRTDLWYNGRQEERAEHHFGYNTQAFFGGDTPEAATPEVSPSDAPSEGTFDGIDIDDFLSDGQQQGYEEEAEMAPHARRHQPQTRNLVVDLTNDDPPSPDQRPASRTVDHNAGASSNQPRSLKRTAETAFAASLNPPRHRPASTSQNENSHAPEIESLDLSTEESLLQSSLQQALAAQASQQAATSAQGNTPARIGQRTCIICLEPFTNAAVTHCGHVYCHECLTQALIAGERNSERGTANCPMCRKGVSRKRNGQVVPLCLMTRRAWVPR